MKKLTLALTLIAAIGCQEAADYKYGSMDHICALNADGNLPEHLIPAYGDESIILANSADFTIFYAVALTKLSGPGSDDLSAEERRVWEDVIGYLPAVLEFRNAEKNQ